LLDGDDYWKPHHISNLVKLSYNLKDCDVFSSNYSIKRSNKFIATKWSNLKEEVNQELEHFFTHNFLNSILNCSNILIKTTSIKKAGFFDEKVTHYEDIDWFIRIGIHLKTAFSKNVTVHIDEDSENRSDLINMNNRKLPEFNKYEQHYSYNQNLEKYLNINWLFIAVDYRLKGFNKEALKYQSKINKKYLTRKQQFLLNRSTSQLKILYKIKKTLLSLNLDLRTGS